MAIDSKIIKEVQLTGADQIERTLRDIGNTGDAAFKKLGESAKFTEGQLRAIDAMAKRTGISVEAMTARVNAAAGGFSNFNKAAATTTQAGIAIEKGATRAAAGTSTWSQALAGLGTALGNARSKVHPLTDAIGGLKNASDQAGKSTGAAGGFLIQFGQNLRLIGRAARVPELSAFARGIGVVGRAATIAVPALAAFGLERITSGAAKAADEFANMAAELKLPTEQFGQLQNVATALGQNVETAGKSFTSTSKLIDQTAQNTAKDTETFRRFGLEIRNSADQSTELQRGFGKINQATFDLNVALGRGQIGIADYIRGQSDLKEQSRQLNRQIQKQNEQTFELERAQRLARIEADRNATVLQKLGINVDGANGKLKKVPEVLRAVADALANTQDATKRQELEFELVAAGIDRTLLPALRKGSAGFDELAKQGAQIRPGFTDAQIATLDAFRIAVDQTLQALGALGDKIGTLAAPALTAFFIQLRDLLVNNRAAIVSFATTLGTILGTAISGLATAFGLLFQGIKFVADLFASFLTLITGNAVSGLQILAGVLVALVVAFAGWIPLVIGAIAAVGLLIQQLQRLGFFDAIKEKFTAFWAFLTAGWQAITDFLTKLFDGTFFLAFIQLVKDAFTGLWQFLVDGFNAAVAAIVNFFQPVIDKINAAIELAKTLAALLGGGGGGSADAFVGPKQLAGGGHVRGPGTSTSDSIPAWLSDNEFVQNARAVKHYGVGFMQALNARLIPRNAFRFNMGGLASAMSKGMRTPGHFASGGLVEAAKGAASALRPFTLNIEGQDFGGLLAPEDVAQKLLQFAVGKQTRRAGRRPTWVK